MSNVRVSIGFNVLDVDYHAKVGARVTTRSAAQTFDDPGYGCEFEVEDIELFEDTPIMSAPAIELPKWLWNVIAESDALADAVSEAERELPRRRGRFAA
jgi:hypothetical protein